MRYKKQDVLIIFSKFKYRNTFLSISNDEGKLLFWQTGGKRPKIKNVKSVTFKGGQKKTWVARETVCKYLVKVVKKLCKNTTELHLNFLAARKYRRLLWRKLKWVRLTKNLKSIKILNFLPFNGCRSKKRKR